MFSRIVIVLTVVFWALYIVSTIMRQFFFDGPGTYQFSLQVVGYAVTVTLLTFSALMYLIARQGALQRFEGHVRVPRAELDHYFESNQPSITVLVPSYSEEVEVIRKTLLSAALQEYPTMRVVLLIDDNPYTTDARVLARLETTRALAGDIEKLLRKPANHFRQALKRFKDSYHQKWRSQVLMH